MLYLIILSQLALCLSAPSEPCTESKCKLPSCLCSSLKVPGNLDPEDVPQMVLLTFENQVTKNYFDKYYGKLLYDRKNPNGCNISATFFVNHENTDYGCTYQLYRQGHEIAPHTITHRSESDYLSNATVEVLKDEYVGQRDILNKFALIPKEKMKGMRSPFLHVGGDNTFLMIKDNGFEWDSSWPTSEFIDPPIWPFTLEYQSIQECPSLPCPKVSHPGVWEIPMIAWKYKETTCSIIDVCPMISDENEIFEFFKTNFHRHYDSNRAPFSMFATPSWLDALPKRLTSYKRFLDYLQTLDDVYIVTISQMLEWVKNPTPTSNMKDFWKCWKIPVDECMNPTTCKLKRPDRRTHQVMTSCVTKCPLSYPWIRNPLGTL